MAQRCQGRSLFEARRGVAAGGRGGAVTGEIFGGMMPTMAIPVPAGGPRDMIRGQGSGPPR